jgi:hypothetical protein
MDSSVGTAIGHLLIGRTSHSARFTQCESFTVDDAYVNVPFVTLKSVFDDGTIMSNLTHLRLHAFDPVERTWPTFEWAAETNGATYRQPAASAAVEHDGCASSAPPLNVGS